MKFVLIVVFIFFFVGLPLYVLNTLVMPQVLSLEHTYSTAGATADAIAGVDPKSN